MNSHPDKVKLSINETMESVANRFVEITKAYKSFVIDYFFAAIPCRF
jgi:preprotein translocase subunit Sec63